MNKKLKLFFLSSTLLFFSMPLRPLSEAVRLALVIPIDIAAIVGMFAVSYYTPKDTKVPEGKENTKQICDIAGAGIELATFGYASPATCATQGALAYYAQKEGINSRFVWGSIRNKTFLLIDLLRHFLRVALTGQFVLDDENRVSTLLLNAARWVPSIMYDIENDKRLWGAVDGTMFLSEIGTRALILWSRPSMRVTFFGSRDVLMADQD